MQKILDYFKRPIKVEVQTEYDARPAQELGNFRIERIARVATRFLTCGDYRQGLARIRCSNPECRQEYFRLFSCKGFYLCPSCSQKRTLLFAEYLDEQLLFTLPHRQFVFTLPKALRVFLRHDQRLFAWLSLLISSLIAERAVRPVRYRLSIAGRQPDARSTSLSGAAVLDADLEITGAAFPIRG